MNMEKEELLQVIEVLNSQVAQLNLENIILKTKIDSLNKENQKDEWEEWSKSIPLLNFIRKEWFYGGTWKIIKVRNKSRRFRA